MKWNAYVPVGGDEEGGVATPTSISIFDSNVMKTLWNIVILLHKQAKRRTIMHTTVTINSIADMFTTRIYNQEKKASKELKLKKDVTLHFSWNQLP